MDSRYTKPAELPPDPRLLKVYLRDAQPTRDDVRLDGADAVEARRLKALAALLALARAELAKAGDPGRLHAMSRSLRQFLEIEGLRILTAEDPVAALRRLLGQMVPGRGRPAEDHDYRDFVIAADVAELRANGMTLNAACDNVSKRSGTPGGKEIERIYLRLRGDLAVRAEVGSRRLRAAENANDTALEIKGQEITREQWQEYSALAAAECPNGMTVEDNLELWSFVRRATFPQKIVDLMR